MHKEVAFREDSTSFKDSKMLFLVKFLYDIHFNNPFNNIIDYMVFQHIIFINITG